VVGGIAGLVHGGWDTTVVVVAAAVWLALSVIGFAQLVRAIRRELA
jgi:CDP-diacylglycerol--glycerol-3-phosphate 3-phosphatidyltransferase